MSTRVSQVHEDDYGQKNKPKKYYSFSYLKKLSKQLKFCNNRTQTVQTLKNTCLIDITNKQKILTRYKCKVYDLLGGLSRFMWTNSQKCFKVKNKV